MEVGSYVFTRTPEIHFGAGSLTKLPELIGQRGSNVLLVTGSKSFLSSSYYEKLAVRLKETGVCLNCVTVSGEPTPDFVDEVADKHRYSGIEVVVAIGGGSVIDAGKAIAAMLPMPYGDKVSSYLESVGYKSHSGATVPLIAVPTTAGTGAEATKNAVLSVVGDTGYKCSLRHDSFVPEVALIDPMLALSCPRNVTATCSLDAFTQLLEAYVSTTASPMTDALALSGLGHFAAGFARALEAGATDLAARTHMAHASLMSGIVLANAGLGLVHGLAGVIGGWFDIPHGVVCGTMIAEVNRATIELLLENKEENHAALVKYASVHQILTGIPEHNIEDACRKLIVELERMVGIAGVNKLGHYGIKAVDLDRIAKKASNKNNPIKLSPQRILKLLENRL